MKSKKSNQQDYILNQVLEMFPQLDTKIVYVVLSENDFKVETAISNLTILAQSVEIPVVESVQSDRFYQTSQPNSVHFKSQKTSASCKTQENCNTPANVSEQVCYSSNSPSLSCESNETSSLSQTMESYKLNENATTVEHSSTGSISNDLTGCSIYLPYYDALHCSNQYQVPQVSNDVSMISNFAVNLSESSKQNDSDDKVVCSDVAIDEKRISSSKSTFIKLLSYVYVGKANGKRLIYHGLGNASYNVFHSNFANQISVKSSTTQNHAYSRITQESKRFDGNSSTQDLKKFSCTDELNGIKDPTIANSTSSEKNKSIINTASSQLCLSSPIPSSIKFTSCSDMRNSHSIMTQSSDLAITNDYTNKKTSFVKNLDFKSLSNPPPGFEKNLPSKNSLPNNSLHSNSVKSMNSVHRSNGNSLQQQAITNSFLPKQTLPFQDSEKNDFIMVSRSNRKQQNRKNPTSLKQSENQTSKLSLKTDMPLLHSYSFVLYVLRGLSGSGKSTLGREILVQKGNSEGQILSTDDFFFTRNGYAFDCTKLSEAHEWNQRRAKDCFCKGISPIIIDNTNSTSWEMKPYMKMAVKFRYQIIILEPNTCWKFKASELAKRNSHGVTKETIKAMLERYERNVTVRSVLGEDSYLEYQQNCLKTSREGQSSVKDTKQQTVEVNSNKPTIPIQPELSDPLNVDKNEDGINSLTIKANLDPNAKSFSPVSSSSNATISSKTPDAIEAPVYKAALNSSMPKSQSSSVTIDESLVSTPSSNKSTRSNNDPSVATKKKRKPKTLAARFPQKTLTAQLSDSNENWKSYMNIIDSQSSVEQSRNPKYSSPSQCDSDTVTEERYFTLVLKLEANIKATTNEVVLTSNSERFKSGIASKRKKLNKILYDKSSMTTDLTQVSDDASDFKTLRILFPEHDEKHLRDVFEKCDGNLNWATDVVAESSLFGEAGDSFSVVEGKLTSPTLVDTNNVPVNKIDSQSLTQSSSNEGKSNSSPADCLALEVSADFLRKLIGLFGDENDDATNAKNSTLTIGYDLAYAIYGNWKSASSSPVTNEVGIASQSRNAKLSHLYFTSDFAAAPGSDALEQLRKDEELARRIQSEEERHNPTSALSRKNRNSPFQSRYPLESSSLSSSKWSVDRVQPQSLSQIMSEEEAAIESVKRQSTKFVNKKLAAQIKREELHAIYPNLPRVLLDEIFVANNYNLEDTIVSVNLMQNEKLSNARKTVSGSLERFFTTDREKNRPLNQNPVDIDMNDNDSRNRLMTYDDVHSDNLATYDEIRAEANMHRFQVSECQKKANLANQQKKGALAFFYGQHAQQHQKLLREANQRAAAVIYRRMNEGRSPNELDLHGLHVDEAIDTLRSVVMKLQREEDSVRCLTVITGRGLNSSDGIPKVKKAVIEWLNNKQIRYEPLNEGCLKLSW